MTMKMIQMNLRDEIKEAIYKVDNKSKFRSSSGWLTTKCPYCDTNSKKSHFNIKLVDNSPIIFKCFRATCGMGGMLNKKTLRKLGINKLELLDKIENEYLKFSKFHKNNEYYEKEESYKLGSISDLTEEYFKSRTNVSAEEHQRTFRIVSSITEFRDLNKNKIKHSKLDFLIKHEANGKKFISFLNDRYTMLYYREIGGSELKGKTSIVNTSDVTLKHKPYSLQNKGEINLHDKGSATLFLAEGTFDIINTYLYFGKNINATFVASTSFTASKSIIMEFSKYKYHPYIVIMSDDDVDIQYYRFNILKYTDSRISHLIVIYNEFYKDMGDFKYGFKPKRIDLK